MDTHNMLTEFYFEMTNGYGINSEYLLAPVIILSVALLAAYDRLFYDNSKLAKLLIVVLIPVLLVSAIVGFYSVVMSAQHFSRCDTVSGQIALEDGRMYMAEFRECAHRENYYEPFPNPHPINFELETVK
jgi:hypothetical protein